jgi:hypothetical protein
MNHFKTFVLLLFIAVIGGCEKDPGLKPRDYTYVVTLEEKENNNSGVTLTGEIFYVAGDIEEYGFVINMSGEPTLDDYVVAKNGNPNKGEFSQRIGVGLEAGSLYYVRAFVRSGQQIVYGNEIIFQSEGTPMPEIYDFSPISGRAGDHITISGKNFSPYAPWNKVSFDGRPAGIVSATETSLIVVVPAIAESRDVIISIIYGYLALDAPDNFENIYP